MNYHNITTDDMLNGDGLRVVLWLAGCEHHCKCCQNPLTWDPDGGIPFDEKAKEELFRELDKPYISGLTISGGDPLHPGNANEVHNLCREVVSRYGSTKTIWIYTGYKWEDIIYSFYRKATIRFADVLVEGPFIEELKDVNYPWAGSTNQRVIDVPMSMLKREVVLHV